MRCQALYSQLAKVVQPPLTFSSKSFSAFEELSKYPKVIDDEFSKPLSVLDKMVCHQYLYKYYGNRVVQHTLPEDKGIKVDVHIEIVEDGEDGDRVRGRDQGSKVEIVDESDVLQVGDNTGT